MESISKNKYNILKILVFMIGFFISLVPISYILREGECKARYAGFYEEKENSIDIVTLGSSTSYTCFHMPYLWQEFGIPGYNLGSGVQPPDATIGLIKEIFKTQSPKVIVLEMLMFTKEDSVYDENNVRDSAIRHVTDSLKYSANRMYLVNKLVSADENRIAYYFDIIKYHTTWKNKKWSTQSLKYWDLSLEDSLKGYVFMPRADKFNIKNYKNVTQKCPIPVDKEAALLEILEYCIEKEVELLFVVTPGAETLDQKKMYNYIQNIIEPYGYNFINMNDLYEELQLDSQKDWADGIHANVYGAEKVTAYIGNYLKNNYELADKRGMKEYESWDKACILWEEQSEIIKSQIENMLSQ